MDDLALSTIDIHMWKVENKSGYTKILFRFYSKIEIILFYSIAVLQLQFIMYVE